MTTPTKSSSTVVPLPAALKNNAPPLNVTIIPLQLKQRHQTTVIVPPPGSDLEKALPATVDLPLLRTLGKAFYWKRLLDTGECANSLELAERLGLKYGWVCEVLRMTLLAPEIVQAVVDGTQPRQLNLHALRGRQSEVPRGWVEQRREFGIGDEGSPSRTRGQYR